jgi:hypothetical protein
VPLPVCPRLMLSLAGPRGVAYLGPGGLARREPLEASLGSGRCLVQDLQ